MKLEEKAMLAKVKISVWEGRKKAKDVEEEIDIKHHSKKATSVRKILFDSPELRAVIAACGDAREVHRTMTVPWNGDGTGILPIESYDTYVKKIRTLRDEFMEKYKVFEAAYREQIEKERVRLGTLFNPKDYPDVREVASKFNFDVFFSPVPTKDDFRINIRSDELDVIKDQFEAQKKSVLTDVSRDLYGRLYKVIEKMHERLNDPEAKFKDSLVKNIADLVEILPKLNFANDEKLTELTKIAEEQLGSIDPEDLRNNKKLREATSNLAKGMMEEIEKIEDLL